MLLWCCGVVVVLWCCCGVVVLLWCCCGVVVVLLWCCGGVVVNSMKTKNSEPFEKTQITENEGNDNKEQKTDKEITKNRKQIKR